MTFPGSLLALIDSVNCESVFPKMSWITIYDIISPVCRLFAQMANVKVSESWGSKELPQKIREVAVALRKIRSYENEAIHNSTVKSKAFNGKSPASDVMRKCREDIAVEPGTLWFKFLNARELQDVVKSIQDELKETKEDRFDG
jgi:hypothetical protein